MKPRFPIYIISKGRWERRQTVKTLESAKVDFKIVVEPQEYKKYAKVINKEKIIVAPENFSERGKGGIPVRNFVWDYSIKQGFDWHWILDDNIESIERYENNLKIKCETPTPFRVIEDFVLRYKNISQAGMNYAFFCPASEARQPVRFNTRIYSCILIRNDMPYRWRGKYNEDTDLSLRMLKDGWVTVLFNQFLIGKRATMSQKGGNTDSIYNQDDNRLAFAESLQKQHPDCVKVTKKFGRFHHQVDYKKFQYNMLERVDNYEDLIGEKINNYDMKIIKIDND
tara:strand:+ start:300 stop:1148 length:849 start_codon:yes stop_codon:yes gene_type:complete